jgi:DNA-binding FadR family transcriptional regulator
VNTGAQMRQPRLAEMVAGVLRERIVSGDLADGGALPGLEKLVQEFGVSPPSLREALRILENEGLITVRRGNVGGAIVHRPSADGAAYMFGLVLQAEQVPVTDLAGALGHLEVLCVRLCATRRDRKRAVLPALRRLHRASEGVIDDAVAFEQSCQSFHDGLVSLCGSRSVALAVSAFEWLWHEQPDAWAHRMAALHEYPAPELRRSGLAAHAEILAAIERGSPEEAERVAREHIQDPRIRGVSASDAAVRATGIPRVSRRGRAPSPT